MTEYSWLEIVGGGEVSKRESTNKHEAGDQTAPNFFWRYPTAQQEEWILHNVQLGYPRPRSLLCA